MNTATPTAFATLATNALAALTDQARNAEGEVDTAVLFRLLVQRGHSEFEAVEHMVTMGCDRDLAVACALEALTARPYLAV